MKTCKRCFELKPSSEYYNGDSSCKPCRRSFVEAHRQEKRKDPKWVERELDRQRQKERRRRESGLASKPSPEASKKWIRLNNQKRIAHHAVNNAVRNGRLTKAPCELCHAEKSEAHHEDYSRPLDVNWLCTTCHNERHNQIRKCLRLKNPKPPIMAQQQQKAS
jgi:hypothetical protein